MFDALATAVWKHLDGVSPYLILAAVAATYIAFHAVYLTHDVYFGPLSKVYQTQTKAMAS
jgi:hypothetical protein